MFKILHGFFQSIITFFNVDWAQSIYDNWKKIDPVYKKSFLYIYIFVNIIFAYHTFNFLWGNHDWAFVVKGYQWFTYAMEARFTETFHYFLFDWQLLPVLNNLFQFAGMTLGAISLAVYWKIPKTVLYYSLFGMFMISIPFNLSNLFHMSQSGFDWLPFVVISAFIIYEKALESKHKFLLNFLIVLMLFYSLGAYATIINTIVLVLIGRFIIEYVFDNKTIKELLWKFKILVVDIAISCFILQIIIWIYRYKQIIGDDFYNVSTINSTECVSKLLESMGYAFIQFLKTWPFINGFYQISLTLLVFAGILCLIMVAAKKGWKVIFPIVTLIVLLLLGSETAIYISQNIHNLQYLSRIVKFGLLFIYMFSVAILMISVQTKTYLKNILLVCLIVFIQAGAVNEVYALKIWKIAKDAEMRELDHVMIRLQSHPDFDAKKTYNVATLGEISVRPYYYTKGKYNEFDLTLIGWSYTAFWMFKDFYNVNYPFLKIQNHFHSGNSDKFGLPINEDIINYIFKKAKAWPHKDSIFIDKNSNIIYICLDENGIYSAKKYIYELLDLESKETKDLKSDNKVSKNPIERLIKKISKKPIKKSDEKKKSIPDNKV